MKARVIFRNHFSGKNVTWEEAWKCEFPGLSWIVISWHKQLNELAHPPPLISLYKMSGQPTTQMQISEWDPENLINIQKSIKWRNEFIGNWRSKIGFILTLLILMMTLCICISVAFCQHEQNKMEQINESKHNLTLQSSMNSVKVRIE